MSVTPDESDSAPETQPHMELRPYTEADASGSLARAGRLVLVLAAFGLPFALWLGGWRSAALLAVGAVISASGLWEWRRLMSALMARMDHADAAEQQREPLPKHFETGANEETKRPSIAFAIAGFAVRMVLVMVVLYVSLKYLHGSVLALAAGLAMGVIALTVEGLRLLRSGTI